MQGLLELLGYRTLTASNGDEALVRFKEHADEIDMVITDRAMPGMMGNELAAALRALRANLPIIMITGGATDAMPVELVSRYLHKPFTKDDLGAAIRSAMPRRANGKWLGREFEVIASPTTPCRPMVADSPVYSPLRSR